MRDTKKYVYYTVGILRGSPLHKELIQEAEEIGKKQVPTMIAIWLRDFRLLRNKSAVHAAQTPIPETSPAIDFEVDLSNAEEADDAFPV